MGQSCIAAKRFIVVEAIADAFVQHFKTAVSQLRSGDPKEESTTIAPIAAIVRVKNTEEAIRTANQTSFGLGGSVWTRDSARSEAIVRQLDVGSAFVNGIVKSDPRLPFGGIKASGFGRELSYHGIREFVNIKTIWVG